MGLADHLDHLDQTGLTSLLDHLEQIGLADLLDRPDQMDQMMEFHDLDQVLIFSKIA